MPMTPEQLARMRELAGAPDLGDGVEIQADPTVQQTTTNAHNDVFTNIPTPTPAGMPGAGMGSKPMTAQEQMRARMRAGNGAHTASTMTQGEQYNPTSSAGVASTPTPAPAPAPAPVHTQSPQSTPTQSPIANQTIINTTQTDADEPKKGFGFKMTPIIAIAITIAVLLAGFLGYSYYVKHKGDAKPTDTEAAETEWVDPFADDSTQWIVPDTQWNYTAEQIQQLRAAGYTGDEIEQYASTQTPYLDLIKQAEAARDAYIQEAIAPLYDTASDEYKHYISQTWLSLRERDDVDGWIPAMTYLEQRKNLDYEKIEVHGNQLFLKVYLDDFAHDDWFYVLVTPEQWNSLNDAGNVLVTYEYATSYDGDDAFTAVEDTNNIYIINAYIDQAY